MKIVSWNVNGMRSVLKQGFVDWLEETKPDVLSLQEIRAEWKELDASVRERIEALYDVCWFPATIKKGYAGSATLSRKALRLSHQKGLGIEAYDQEGRIVVSQHDAFTLLAGYFPNAGQKLVRLPFKRQFSRDLVRIIGERHANNEPLIVVGDLNVAPEEIDLANPQSNRRNPGFTDEEREDFRSYLNAGLYDVLRQKNPGKKGLYTWWSMRSNARERNIGWRIDIFLLSEALLPKVKDIQIHPEVKGSDHCPISLELSL